MREDIKDVVKKSVIPRKQLDSDIRHFKFNEECSESWQKEFNYKNQDVKLLRFARDEIGMISDLFLLYAVAILGIADLDTIRSFLSTIKNNDVGGQIMDVSKKDLVKLRIKSLHANGLLFRYRYNVYALNTEGENVVNEITLYTLEPDSQAFMNNKLAKRTVFRDWFAVKPMYELIGWAAAGYVATEVARKADFLEFKQGVFKTKAIGTVFNPCILKVNLKTAPDSVTYIGFFSSFLHHDSKIHLTGDYEDICIRLVSSIKQYFFFRDQKKSIARAVVVCEDNADLVEITSWIHKMENVCHLKEDYDRLYFTGEGIVKNSDDISKCFLQMVEDTTEKRGYSIVSASPDFV